MKEESKRALRSKATWILRDSGSLDGLKRLCETETNPADWPLASEVTNNVLVYDASAAEAKGAERAELMAEWCDAFRNGPGVVVIRQAISDTTALDKATELFSDIIEQERQHGAVGDYFAKKGANDRVWNSLEKQCVADPANFAAYFGGAAIDLVSRAWLGDGYQMTAQVNRVNPGGTAQFAHRDYHLGFMTGARMELFPAHVHMLSPMLTLQGAVAHVDMPLETGPTMYLPYSQLFFEGYLAFSRPEFQSYFDQNRVQLPLRKGDAVFFNPAVMHAAGTNVTEDRYRMGNLLQVSSAMGRAMETINRLRMVKALYPTLLASQMGLDARARVIAASAEGYSFPTNLDRDPPIGGRAPKTQAMIMAESLDAALPSEDFNALVDDLEMRRLS